MSPFQKRRVFASMSIEIWVGQGVEQGADGVSVPTGLRQLVLYVVRQLNKVLSGR